MKSAALLAATAFTALATACGSSSTSTPTPSGSAPAVAALQLASKTGLTGSALSTSAGLTMYRFTPDFAGTPTCTGSCAATWPAVVAGSSLPQLPSGLTGTLGSVTRSDGTRQLTYDSWPLYTYKGDTATGDANGQGIEGKWFAIDASTQPPSGATAPATPTAAPATTPTAASNGGGYGY